MELASVKNKVRTVYRSFGNQQMTNATEMIIIVLTAFICNRDVVPVAGGLGERVAGALRSNDLRLTANDENDAAVTEQEGCKGRQKVTMNVEIGRPYLAESFIQTKPHKH
jgi:hypothetical protein